MDWRDLQMPLLSKGQKRNTIATPKCRSIYNIRQNYNEPAELLCGDEWITSACLKCTDQKCIRYIDEEISCREFPDFSYKRDLNVCPVEAISWNYSKEIPQVDNSKCIGCGLCASRYPVGAIYRENNQMKIAEPNENYELLSITHPLLEQHKKMIMKLESLPWKWTQYILTLIVKELLKLNLDELLLMIPEEF